MGAEGYVFLVGSNQLYEGSYFWSKVVQKTLRNSVNFEHVHVFREKGSDFRLSDITLGRGKNDQNCERVYR